MVKKIILSGKYSKFSLSKTSKKLNTKPNLLQLCPYMTYNQIYCNTILSTLKIQKRNMPQYVVRFHTGLKQGRVGISLVKVDVTSVLALITIRVGRKQVQR